LTATEHAEFMQAKAIIEAVHRRLGMPGEYKLRQWVADQQALRESTRRKLALRQMRPAFERVGE
jgi:hypothetical protein